MGCGASTDASQASIDEQRRMAHKAALRELREREAMAAQTEEGKTVKIFSPSSPMESRPHRRSSSAWNLSRPSFFSRESARRYSKKTVEGAIYESPEPARRDQQGLTPAAERRGSGRTTVREGVSAGAAGSEEGYTKVVVPKSDEDRQLLASALKAKGSIFASLDAEMAEIVDVMTERDVEDGEVVITMGEDGDNLYVVGSGTFEARLDDWGAEGEVVATYGLGDAFGELALLHNAPRAATVTCCAAGKLWALGRVAFRALVISQVAAAKQTLLAYLETVPALSELEPSQRANLAGAMETMAFGEGATIFSEGAPADSLFLVVSGSVVCQRAEGGEDLLELPQGAFFGESALLEEGAKRLASVRAKGAGVRCARLMVADVQQLVGSLKEAVSRNFNRKILTSMPLLVSLSERDVARLLEVTVEKSFSKGETILKQGEAATALYVIKAGECSVMKPPAEEDLCEFAGSAGSKPERVATLKSGDFFGERSLLTSEPCAATITADSTVLAFFIEKERFEQMLGPLKGLMEREMRKREQAERASKWQLADFEFNGRLGEGSMSRVILATHSPTGRSFALKSLRKGRLIRYNQLKRVCAEKKVLEMCDHPFVLRMVSVFNTPRTIMMLFAPSLGGDLYRLLQARGKLDEGTTRFYAACVASAFAYLHSRKIAHRDLKPENLLLETDGYIKLIDFGFAKVIKDHSTWTLCGTPEYLAPEIVTNKGHSVGCDWWTLGVLLMEMMTGVPPFTGKTQLDTYNKILKCKFKPPAAASTDAKDLITKLLNPNPSNRVGCWKRGADDVLGHGWFSEVDLAMLEAKVLRAPFIPKVSGPLDTSNFDISERQLDTSMDAEMDEFLDATYDDTWKGEFGEEGAKDALHLDVPDTPPKAGASAKTQKEKKNAGRQALR